jgi:TrmH family RNA methyltransferase
MIRTCDWFGLGGVLLGRNSVELYNPKVVRATMGGVFHLRVADDVDLLSAVTKAKEAGYSVYVADTSGEVHIDRVRFAEKTMVVFGNEAWGVSDRLKECADVRVAIRRYGAAESLNVAVACGIFLAGIHRVNDE